jgi:hypothetical protein
MVTLCRCVTMCPERLHGHAYSVTMPPGRGGRDGPSYLYCSNTTLSAAAPSPWRTLVTESTIGGGPHT